VPNDFQGAQFAYNFQTANGLPLTVYAGFDTLKYNTCIGSPFAPFDTTSGTLPVYSAHAGVEFRPTSDISLGLGFGYTQQSGRIDSDINSPSLPGASPFAVSGRRQRAPAWSRALVGSAARGSWFGKSAKRKIFAGRAGQPFAKPTAVIERKWCMRRSTHPMR
jgi:hypothetical protein